MSEENIFQQVQQQQQQQMSNVQARSGFEVPVEVVPLPSKGLVYSLDNPLANEDSVEIKALTANEENILTSQALIKNGTVLSRLLEACICNKTIHAESLLTGDRNAILTALRISGYGADYDVRVQCPACGEEFVHTFDLSKIPLKPLGAQPMSKNVNAFLYTLPVSKKSVVFKLLTGKDELELSRQATAMKKVGQIQKSVTSRLQQSVLEIDGERDPQKLAYAIQNMPARDARALRNYIDGVECGLDMRQDLECQMCGEVSPEVNVTLGVGFFWPDARI